MSEFTLEPRPSTWEWREDPEDANHWNLWSTEGGDFYLARVEPYGSCAAPSGWVPYACSGGYCQAIFEPGIEDLEQAKDFAGDMAELAWYRAREELLIGTGQDEMTRLARAAKLYAAAARNGQVRLLESPGAATSAVLALTDIGVADFAKVAAILELFVNHSSNPGSTPMPE